MIVTHLEDIVGTEREVLAENGNWASRRFPPKKDGMGFAFHERIILAGTETWIWYKNHLEAVYCVGGEGEGEGEIEDLEAGLTHRIRDGAYPIDGDPE